MTLKPNFDPMGGRKVNFSSMNASCVYVCASVRATHNLRCPGDVLSQVICLSPCTRTTFCRQCRVPGKQTPSWPGQRAEECCRWVAPLLHLNTLRAGVRTSQPGTAQRDEFFCSVSTGGLEATEEPVNCAATGEPVNCRATEEPVVCTATEEPVICAATEELVNCAATEEPVVCAATEEPVNCTDTEEPVICAATEEPDNCAATEEPANCTATEEPVNCTATEEPVNCTVQRSLLTARYRGPC